MNCFEEADGGCCESAVAVADVVGVARRAVLEEQLSPVHAAARAHRHASADARVPQVRRRRLPRPLCGYIKLLSDNKIRK